MRKRKELAAAYVCEVLELVKGCMLCCALLRHVHDYTFAWKHTVC